MRPQNLAQLYEQDERHAKKRRHCKLCGEQASDHHLAMEEEIDHLRAALRGIDYQLERHVSVDAIRFGIADTLKESLKKLPEDGGTPLDGLRDA